MTGRPVAVVGGGLMGAGIAQMFAAGGRSVCVYEPANAVCRTVVARIPENLGEIGGDPAAAELVEVTNDPARAVRGACFVTEAAPEKLAVKQAIFADLERYASEDAILASNSSAMRTAGRSRPRASRPYRAPGRSVQKHRAGSPASARPSSAAAPKPAQQPRSDHSYDRSHDHSNPQQPHRTPRPQHKGAKHRRYWRRPERTWPPSLAG